MAIELALPVMVTLAVRWLAVARTTQATLWAYAMLLVATGLVLALPVRTLQTVANGQFLPRPVWPTAVPVPDRAS